MAPPSVIAAGTELRGRLTVAADLRFAGRLDGELRVRGDLTVDPGAAIDGPLEARTATIAGAVRGAVRGLEKVAVLRGGSVAGDVAAPCIVLGEGSELDGRIEIAVGQEPPPSVQTT